MVQKVIFHNVVITVQHAWFQTAYTVSEIHKIRATMGFLAILFSPPLNYFHAFLGAITRTLFQSLQLISFFGFLLPAIFSEICVLIQHCKTSNKGHSLSYNNENAYQSSPCLRDVLYTSKQSVKISLHYSLFFHLNAYFQKICDNHSQHYSLFLWATRLIELTNQFKWCKYVMQVL